MLSFLPARPLSFLPFLLPPPLSRNDPDHLLLGAGYIVYHKVRMGEIVPLDTFLNLSQERKRTMVQELARTARRNLRP